MVDEASKKEQMKDFQVLINRLDQCRKVWRLKTLLIFLNTIRFLNYFPNVLFNICLSYFFSHIFSSFFVEHTVRPKEDP